MRIDELVEQEIVNYPHEHTREELEWLSRFVRKYREVAETCRGGMGVFGV